MWFVCRVRKARGLAEAPVWSTMSLPCKMQHVSDRMILSAAASFLYSRLEQIQLVLTGLSSLIASLFLFDLLLAPNPSYEDF